MALPAWKTGTGWLSSIVEQRDQIEAELRDSPSLRAAQDDLFAAAYGTARKKAAIETRLPLDIFPTTPPFTLEQALDPDWLPGPPDDQSSTASKGS